MRDPDARNRRRLGRRGFCAHIEFIQTVIPDEQFIIFTTSDLLFIRRFHPSGSVRDH
jgi:hypothetical protein